MGTISQGGNAPLNTLKPQPGQSNSYNPKFHPLPGVWAQEQLNGKSSIASLTQTGSLTSYKATELDRALAAERAQHEYWEEWQGVKPGKAVYENPREMQNTLLPSAKYGTEGRGYG
jgi:hypothetical protein